MSRILITGAAGFIGSFFARRWTDAILIDSLAYAADTEQLRSKSYWHDLRAPFPDSLMGRIGKLDYIIHLAAETHVDRSLTDPRPFVETNVLGTFNLLEYARLYQPQLRCLFYISTDEVYGPAPNGTNHREDDPHRPSNPYSATKAAAEDLCYAWAHSMGVPVIVTNTMNNIGEGQHPEKFLPKIIRAIEGGEIITVHGTPDNPGSRKYLYAGDHVDAIEFLMVHGSLGEKYNVVGSEEINNLEMVRRVERIMGREAKVRFVDFHATRPGHDRRYSLDGGKLKALGWEPTTQIDDVLEGMVKSRPAAE